MPEKSGKMAKIEQISSKNGKKWQFYAELCHFLTFFNKIRPEGCQWQ